MTLPNSLRLGLAVALIVTTFSVAIGNETNSCMVAELIRKLGDAHFAEREAASNELHLIGEPALGALRKAADSSDDAEIRFRARQIINAVTRRAAGKVDLEQLQGTWYTTSISHMGNASGEDPSDTMTYEGNKYVQRRNGEVCAVGTIAIVDPTARLKQMEFLVSEGPHKGFHFRSIYSLDGDNLQICSDDGNNNRPLAFTGQAGYLRTMKRLSK